MFFNVDSDVLFAFFDDDLAVVLCLLLDVQLEMFYLNLLMMVLMRLILSNCLMMTLLNFDVVSCLISMLDQHY